MMNKKTLNLLSGTILIFSIVLSGACKKKENFPEKIGGCYDTDSPIHDGTVDYDDGSCKYAYVNMYELTNHPAIDPANSGQDWDILAIGNATRPDVVLTITNPLTGVDLFLSPEIGDIDPNSSPQWVAPYEIKLLNQNLDWTLYDIDVSGSELMASGTFNPIELANNGKIVTSTTNALNDSTTLTLYYTLK